MNAVYPRASAPRSLVAAMLILLAVLLPLPVEGQDAIPRVEEVAFTDGLFRYILDDIIEVTVTFSEEVAVTGMPQIDLPIESMTRQADYQSGPPSTELVFRYTVTETDEDTDGLTINANALKLNGGSIKRNNTDIDADLAHEAHQDHYIRRVDGITPVLWTAAVHGAHLVLTYSETIWPYSGIRVSHSSDYEVMVNNVRRDVSDVAISGRAVTLTLASAVTPTDQVTLSYTVRTSGPIRDEGGNIVAALTDQVVTTSAPYVSSLEISSEPAALDTYAGGEEIEIEVTFSESVTVTGTPHLFLTFDSTGSYERAAHYETGSGTPVLVFRYSVAEGFDRFLAWALQFLGWDDDPPSGDEAPDGLSIAADALHMHDGTIRDSDDYDALLILDALTDAEEHKVDGVWPAFDSVDSHVVEGTTLTLRHDERLDEDSVPAPAAFTVTAGIARDEVDASPPVTDVSIDGDTLTLTLSTPVEESAWVRVSYTAPDETPLQDLVGNNKQDENVPGRLVRRPRLVVSFDAADYETAEDGTATVTVKLDKNPQRRVDIPLTTTRGGVTDDAYRGVPRFVIFSRDEPLTETFTATIRDDAVDDAGESLQSIRIGFGSPLPPRMEVGSHATTVVTVAEPTDPPPPPPPPDTPPEEDTDDAARTVAVGGVTRSTVRTAATCDQVEMHLEAGTTYRIDLAGASTEGGSLPDPYLGGLYDPAGSLIPGTTNDDGGPGRNSQVSFTPPTAGTYSVKACAYGASSGGTYTLSVEEIADDFSADTDTKGTVTVGGSATGEVQAAGDIDWFRVSLAADTSYVIELAGVLDCEDCTLLEPALHGLYDAGGTLIADTTPAVGAGQPSRVTFTPPTAGPYYVAAGAHGDGVGTYTVRVGAGTADP